MSQINSTLTYQRTDPKYVNYVSKGDAICFTQDNKQYTATAISISPSSTRIQVERSDRFINVKNETVSIKEKLAYNGPIPIEVNDLVCINYDNEPCSAIVVGFDNNTNKIHVFLAGSKRKTIEANVSELNYLAKGYVQWVSDDNYTMSNSNIQNNTNTNRYTATNTNASSIHVNDKTKIGNASQTGNAYYSSSQQNQNQTMDTSRATPAVALLYPAPCVVMAVPHLTDPNSYPEAMAVHLPWNQTPTVLPVVRMGSGTVLVVVPSANPQGNQIQVAQIATNTNTNQVNTAPTNASQTVNISNANVNTQQVNTQQVNMNTTNMNTANMTNVNTQQMNMTNTNMNSNVNTQQMNMVNTNMNSNVNTQQLNMNPATMNANVNSQQMNMNTANMTNVNAQQMNMTNTNMNSNVNTQQMNMTNATHYPATNTNTMNHGQTMAIHNQVPTKTDIKMENVTPANYPATNMNMNTNRTNIINSQQVMMTNTQSNPINTQQVNNNINTSTNVTYY